MSSVCVSWSSSSEPAEDVYAGNHEWLSLQFSNVVSEISDKEREIVNLVDIDLDFEETLQSQMDEILSQHTWSLFNSSNYMAEHDNLVDEFNDIARDMKFELESMFHTVKFELAEEIDDIILNIDNLDIDSELDLLYSDILNLKSKLLNKSSIEEKEEYIEEVTRLIKEYNEKVKRLNDIRKKINNKIDAVEQDYELKAIYSKLLEYKSSVDDTNLDNLIDNYTEELNALKAKRKQEAIDKQNEEISLQVTDSLNILSLFENYVKLPLSKEDNRKNMLLNKIFIFTNKINSYDAKRYKHITKQNILIEESSLERLKLLLSSTKLEYGKVKSNYIWTKVYKDELNALKIKIGTQNDFNKSLFSDINRLLAKQFIKRTEYKIIETKVKKYIKDTNSKEKLAFQLQQNLEQLGYTIKNDVVRNSNEVEQKLNNGEVVYLDTDNIEYKIMLKINKDYGFAIRFVRVVGKEVDITKISTYQKQKDKENAKKWCNSYDKLKDLMNKNNIVINEQLRLEPENSDVMYVVDSSIKKAMLKQNKTENRNIKKAKYE